MSLQAIRPQKIKQKAAQKQSTEQQQITQQDSLGVVNLLLQTGLGCVTFLRGIFPERAYKDDKIDSSSIPGLKAEKAKPSSVRTKTLKRGQVPEADNVLDYMEHGVSDALKKGYLKTFMFGIYLDPEQPQNLVELYTFNFIYRDLASKDGQGNEESLRVPEMEVRDQLRGMSIGSVGARNNAQNAGSSETQTEEAKKWTVSEVRKQVQALVKSLLIMTQNLSELPRKRYITFKLYYTADTPPDYEPPHFHSVDHEAAKFTIGTRDAEHQPETEIVGRVDTGHHCLTLRLVSVADQLPDQDELRQSQQVGPPAAVEASQRNIIWDGEDMTLDDECDISFETMEEKEAIAAQRKPLGRRDPKTGELVALTAEEEGKLDRKKDGRSGNILDEMDLDTQIDDTPPRAVEEAPKPVRTGTIQYALPPEVVDKEATQLLSDAEKLKAVAEAQDPVYTQETFPLPAERNEERDNSPPPATQPFPVDSYMFSQSQEETEAIDESFRTERSNFAQSETVPSRLLRRESTFGYSSLMRPSGERAKPEQSKQQKEAEPEAQQESPIMQFDETQDQVENVATAVQGRGRKDFKPMRVESPEESEEIQEETLPAQDQKKQQDQMATPGPSRNEAKNAKNTGDGTPNDPIKLPDSPTVSPLSNVEDDDEDSLPPSIPIFAKMKNTATPSKSSVETEKTSDKKSKGKGIAVKSSNAEQKEEKTDCDCGEIQDDGEMMFCEACRTWVHTVCYGYEEGSKTPDDFLCYRCVASGQRSESELSKEELDAYSKVHAELSCLALFRRALWIVYEAESDLENCIPMTAFAKRLGADLQTAKGIWDRLVKEKFLLGGTLLAGSSSSNLYISETGTKKRGKKKGAAAKPEPPRLNKSKEQLKLKKTKYFTPQEDQEKEILLEHGLIDADADIVTESRATSLAVPTAPMAPVSPPRKQLADIRHSPRANSNSPNVMMGKRSTAKDKGKETLAPPSQAVQPPSPTSTKVAGMQQATSTTGVYVPKFGKDKDKAAAAYRATNDTAMASDETALSASALAPPTASNGRYRNLMEPVLLAGQRAASTTAPTSPLRMSRKRSAEDGPDENDKTDKVKGSTSGPARKKVSMAEALPAGDEQFDEDEFEQIMSQD